MRYTILRYTFCPRVHATYACNACNVQYKEAMRYTFRPPQALRYARYGFGQTLRYALRLSADAALRVTGFGSRKRPVGALEPLEAVIRDNSPQDSSAGCVSHLHPSRICLG